MSELFFSGWGSLIHVVVVGVVCYVTLLVTLRLSGKRTLSRMNAYDMIITMALGAVLTKAMLTKDQSLADSVLAIVLLIGFQYVVSVLSCNFDGFRNLVTPKPAVLYHDGKFARDVMRKERVTEKEVEAAVHEKGVSGLDCVDAVILGANGELSVLVKPDLMNPVAIDRKRQGRI
jgi:uncharacterized membrane protein YcaP (DUF421 family)